MGSLLGIDLGVRTGLALYGEDGRLRWCRSQNFGSAARLRRGVGTVLRDIPDLGFLVMEGDRNLADLWLRASRRQGQPLPSRVIGAEVWRASLLHARERRHGAAAKQHAQDLALEVIAWSQAPRPTGRLRHDAAEAVLVGLWGVLELGWLAQLPPELRLARR
jgi:hypothetical protein